jgi:competence protein ComEC
MSILEIWLRSPLLRIVLPLLAGIYGCDLCGLDTFCACVLVGYAAYFFMRWGINRHWDTFYNSFHIGIFYSCLWITIGVGMQRITDRQTDSWHVLQHAGKRRAIAMRLADEPIESNGRFKVQGEVLGVDSAGMKMSCRGLISLTIERDSSHLHALHVDDVIVAYFTPQLLDGPRNPLEFDYASYMRRQDVWLQGYVPSDMWCLDSSLHKSTVHGAFIRWREQMLHQLSFAAIEPREVGVLSALVLGKSSAIDREVMQTYASAGVVHVLAVSGLHVALIYMLLKPLFERLWGKGKARKLKTVVPTVLLWFYAAMTGFSPSVLRAAWMFSFVIVADNYGMRNTNYNTMAASALLLLCFDPQVAFSMGFMLSYLAVIGIAAIHPTLHRMCYFQSRVGKWLWELSSVSISAQVATMPLTLYLFHQFPTWFVLTNALVIPLSTIILYLALFFFAALAYAPLASFVGGLLGLLTRIMNDLMQWAASWPCALIDQIYWEPWEALVCAALIVTLCFTFLDRNRRAGLWSVGLISFWIAGNTIQLMRKQQQEEVCMHSSFSVESITAYNQGCLSIISSDPIKENRLLNYRLSLESNACDTIEWGSCSGTSNIISSHPWMQVNDCLLFIADSSLRDCSTLDSSVVVYFTDKGKPHFWKQEELRKVHGHTVILGNKLSRKRRWWLKTQLRDSCRVFDLKDGAVFWREGRWVIGKGVSGKGIR